jgi:hypothetical protein
VSEKDKEEALTEYKGLNGYLRNTSRMNMGNQLSIFITRIKIRITTGI